MKKLMTSVLILISIIIHAQNGILDTAFGDSGTVVLPCQDVSKILTQTDGKIIALCGNIISRFHSNGVIDSSFGTYGSSIDTSLYNYKDAALQLNGNIITVSDFSSGLIVTRYKANGEIDSLFGNQGKYSFVDSVSFVGFQSEKIIEDQQGNIVILATTYSGLESSCIGLGVKPSNTNFAAIRLDSNGILDLSFNGKGIADSIFNTKYANAKNIIQQQDGKYLIVGSVPDVCAIQKDLGIARLMLNGKLDSSFAVNGRLLKLGSEGSYTDLILTNSQKIIAIGSDSTYCLINKYYSNGSIDSSFGTNGNQYYNSNFWIENTASLLLDSTILVSALTNIWLLDMNGELADSCKYKQIDMLAGIPAIHTTTGFASAIAFNGFNNFYMSKPSGGFQKLILTHQLKSDSLQESRCAKYIFNGNEYRSSGIYQDTLQTVQGCDSIIFLDLTITPVDNAVSQNGAIFTASSTSTSYQWLDCNTMQIIPGETMQTFTATANGSYAVIVTENGCTDTSGCYTINTIGLEEWSSAGINVYPNPSSGSFTIDFENLMFEGSLSVYSLSGQRVYQQSVKGQPKLELSLKLAKGVYLLKLSSQNQNLTQRIIIQ